MSFEDAVREAAGGAIIDFDVSPGAKQARVPSGYNPWRRRLEVKLKAPPDRGRANEELIGELASLLDVPEASIEITSGARDSLKSIRVSGVTRGDVIKMLGRKLR